MALVLKDRVQETGTANTTVSFTLSGASPGFQSFSAIGDGNTTFYSATDASGNWEAGIGTYSTTGPTLTRTTILSSSNSNTAVTFGGGVTVFVTYPSEKSVNLDGAGNVTGLGTVSSGTWQGSTVAVAYGGTGVTSSSGANSVVLRDANGNVTGVNNAVIGITFTTASAGTTTLIASSTQVQALVGSTSHTFRLPDATTLIPGIFYTFSNASSGTLTVEDYTGAVIETIEQGGAAQNLCTSTATVAGTWGYRVFAASNVTWGNAHLDYNGAITSATWEGDTIAPAHGGTGLTGFVAADNALYSTGASTLTAGTLPIAAGGTGATSASTARTNLGLGSTDDVTFDDVTATKLITNTIAPSSSGVLLQSTATDSITVLGMVPSATATGFNEGSIIQLSGNVDLSNFNALGISAYSFGAFIGGYPVGTATAVDLTISNNSNPGMVFKTDGEIALGVITVDQTNNRIGIGNSTPSTILDVTGTITATDMAFQTYSEKVETVGTISTSTYNLDLSLANVFDITLGANVTLTFTNPVAAGVTKPVTLIVRQPASSPGRLLTVTGAQYTDGVTPVLSTGANQKDVLSFWSIDGGTTYFGTFAMANVS
jgi:hypothetical protein